MFNEDQQVEDRQALAREVVPRTLQSLFVLRITLCVAAAVLAVVKITLSTWMNAANLIITGLLSTGLALIVATFLIHARVLGFVASETATGRGAQ